VHDQLTNTMTGPDFLEAYADQQLAIGNEINAAEFRRRAREWHNDVATRDHCEGCYPGSCRTTHAPSRASPSSRRRSPPPTPHFDPRPEVAHPRGTP
jgi:hypothetical protein